MLTASEVALVVAGLALLGTAATVAQKRFTDRRDAWWARTQWALERILAAQSDDDTERTIGLAILTALQGSRLATDEERRMLEEVADVLLPPAPDE
jgi:steroid 5-alpha reductase family enzyme